MSARSNPPSSMSLTHSQGPVYNYRTRHRCCLLLLPLLPLLRLLRLLRLLLLLLPLLPLLLLLLLGCHIT